MFNPYIKDFPQLGAPIRVITQKKYNKIKDLLKIAKARIKFIRLRERPVIYSNVNSPPTVSCQGVPIQELSLWFFRERRYSRYRVSRIDNVLYEHRVEFSPREGCVTIGSRTVALFREAVKRHG